LKFLWADVQTIHLIKQNKCFCWQSSNETQHHGLGILQSLIKDSITNRTSCFKAGALSFLLDWFSVEERDDVTVKIAQLIQNIGGHSMSGKDIRKIFALLRGDRVGSKQRHSSLLLSSVGYMLKEKGPEAFFEFSGHDSVSLFSLIILTQNIHRSFCF
jgi:hypothetical protein